ncbi:hypothetical protein N7478_000610 [Penicillium angulare]|uniref:uncharacterized protein n=1 Tax=Penicillium angulare TaxID=116970 RepID=UPI00254028F1|nr:uncharacterized protein N7478_000610 [Penicillium angulare]KAJ5291359.1 hypothetical protein N7478_000610 [Penicillium angulare]
MFAPGAYRSSLLLSIPSSSRCISFPKRNPKLTQSVSGQEPQLSKEDLKAGEVEACQTVQMAIAGGILLYLSPFAIDFAKKFL